ncbi:hypothetical protein ONR57_20800 [Hoyosella sp. YIM 151337]|nr:hypothetical protein [Hoyosella sp. YIM 151337]MCW4355749.1 hypothetical protein [Hoyosella sp. YIM 151337]
MPTRLSGVAAITFCPDDLVTWKKEIADLSGSRSLASLNNDD